MPAFPVALGIGRRVALSAVVVVIAIQFAATAGGASYQAALTGSDSCFMASDQRAKLAFNWSVDAASTSTAPFAWRIEVEDSHHEVVQVDTGDLRVPDDLRGQSVVSWFSIDTRREIAPDKRAPGKYQLDVELVDTTATPGELAYTDAAGNSARILQLPVEIGPFTPCDLPSTIP
jgi:hypothetical protein